MPGLPEIAAFLIPFGGWLYLAMFIPVLGTVSATLKGLKSAARLDATIEQLQLRDTTFYKLWESFPQPSIISQVWFPLAVTTLMCLYLSSLLIYSHQAVPDAAQFCNIFLNGALGQKECAAATSDALTALGYAYLGWYCWSIATIFARMVTMELLPATFYSVLTRLILCLVVAVVAQTCLNPISGDHVSPAFLGFGTGLFPDSVLMYIARKFRKLFLSEDATSEPFPLDLVQGISTFRKFRLLELGIDNCANLASSNPFLLYVSSNLALAEVIDWVAQAQLIVLVGQERAIKLQAQGYRTIFDFDRGGQSAALPRLAELLEYTKDQITDLSYGVRTDPSFQRLADLRRNIMPEDAPVPAVPFYMPSPPTGLPPTPHAAGAPATAAPAETPGLSRPCSQG